MVPGIWCLLLLTLNCSTAYSYNDETSLQSGQVSKGLLERSWGDSYLMGLCSSTTSSRGSAAAPPCYLSCRGSWALSGSLPLVSLSPSLCFLCFAYHHRKSLSIFFHLTEARGHWLVLHLQQLASHGQLPVLTPVYYLKASTILSDGVPFSGPPTKTHAILYCVRTDTENAPADVSAPDGSCYL